MLSPVKRHLKYQELIRETPKMLSATKIPSASTAKRLEVEQVRFIKRG